MKINWNKKYTTYAIYAAIVSAAVIFCIFLGVYIRSIYAWAVKVARVFAPLVYGVIIAYILTPIVNLFEKRVFVKIRNGVGRRVLSVTATYFVFLGAFILIIRLVLPQITSSFTELQATLPYYSQSLQNWIDGISAKQGILADIVRWATSKIDLEFLSSPLSALVDFAYEYATEYSTEIMAFITSFMGQLINIFIGVIFAGYILCSKELLFAQLNKLAHAVIKKQQVEKLKKGISYADKTFGRYIMGTLLDAMIVGILVATGMLIFGMDYVPLVSVLIACTNVIPIFGPFIGGIPAFFIIFIADPLDALWFVLMLFIIQQIDGNFIAPRVLGSSTGLPALYVIIAITVMGGIFGVPGMIIGVPVFAIIGKIISEKTESRLKAKSSGEQTAESESIVDETSVSEATAEQQNESDEAAQTVSEVEEK